MILIPLVIDLFCPTPYPVSSIASAAGSAGGRRLNREPIKSSGASGWLLVTACLMLGLQGLRLLPEPIRLSLSIGLAWLMLAAEVS